MHTDRLCPCTGLQASTATLGGAPPPPPPAGRAGGAAAPHSQGSRLPRCVLGLTEQAWGRERQTESGEACAPGSRNSYEPLCSSLEEEEVPHSYLLLAAQKSREPQTPRPSAMLPTGSTNSLAQVWGAPALDRKEWLVTVPKLVWEKSP